MTHDPDARSYYDAHGYYVAPQLAQPGLLDAYLNDIDRLTIAQLKRNELRVVEGGGLDPIHTNLSTLHHHNQTRYLATLLVFNRLKSLFNLFLSPAIANICSRLGVAMPMMHTLPIVHIMSEQLRISGGYFGFEAHQDWTGLQTSLNAVTVWLPFHDVDDEHFPLEVAPGTHMQGLFPGHLENNDYTLDPGRLSEIKFQRIHMKKGDVVFMTPFTVHRTRLSSGDALRIAASWRYEDASERTLAEREFPFAQKRVVNHNLLFPGFPSAAEMKKIHGCL